MSLVNISKTKYTVTPVKQWDVNHVLTIRGLSLAKAPEIHFANAAMERAIKRQATMDSTGIIKVTIPNSLLQKPYKIVAYICQYSGATFETLHKIEIPVTPRPQPADYTIEDDEEIYSFNDLERKVNDAVENLNDATALLETANDNIKVAEQNYEAASANLATTLAQANTATEQANYVYEHAESIVENYEKAKEEYENALVVVNGAGPAVVGMSGNLTADASLDLEDYHTYSISALNTPAGTTLTLNIKPPENANMRYCKVFIKTGANTLNLSMPDVEEVVLDPSGIAYRIPTGSEYPAILDPYSHYVIDIFDYYVTFTKFTILGN